MATSRKNVSSSKNGRDAKSGSTRRSPGSTGKGQYYHVELRPDEDFATFRTQDVGDPGHIQRVAGKREGGSWATVKWLISKQDAHVEGDRLVGDTSDAKDILKSLRSSATRKSGDRFEAKVRNRSASTAGQKKTATRSGARKQASKGTAKGKSR